MWRWVIYRYELTYKLLNMYLKIYTGLVIQSLRVYIQYSKVIWIKKTIYINLQYVSNSIHAHVKVLTCYAF